jgi:hypothetical protein
MSAICRGVSLWAPQHIVLAYADRKRGEHHRRTESGWERKVLSTSESVLELDAVEFRVDLERMTTNVEAIRRLFGVESANDYTGNLPAMPGSFPIIRRRSCATAQGAARPLPNGSLKIVASGEKVDKPLPA